MSSVGRPGAGATRLEAFAMGDIWDDDPATWRYWIEPEKGLVYRTSLAADEVYSFGDHAWVGVDFWDVISNNCEIERIAEREALAAIASREAEVAAREAARPPKAFKLPPYGPTYRGLLS